MSNPQPIYVEHSLLEVCKQAKRSLHAMLAVAYTYDGSTDTMECKTCKCRSPLNADRRSFRLVHDADCITYAAIQAEWDLFAAIAQNEGDQ